MITQIEISYEHFLVSPCHATYVIFVIHWDNPQDIIQLFIQNASKWARGKVSLLAVENYK